MKELIPSHYKILLVPDLEKFEFEGEVDITFEASAPVEAIELNILDIEVSSCRLVREEKITDCMFLVNLEKEQLSISLPESLGGAIHIAIKYQGKINDLMAGLYRSKYAVDGKTKYIARRRDR